MKKMELYKKAKSSGDVKDWELFKTYKGRVNSLLVRKKRIYITKTLHSSRNNPRGFWKEMGRNLRVGKHKPSTGCTAVKNQLGEIVGDKEAAEVMNDYYINMRANLAKDFKSSWEPSAFFDVLNVTGFSFNFVTTNVVIGVLKSLPINKSSSVKNLSTRLLRDGLLCMNVELTHLINECLRLSIMPNLWKLGTITPMPKGKISMKPGDWRPVSVLPYPSKIIEKVVNHQLVYHFDVTVTCFLINMAFVKV